MRPQAAKMGHLGMEEAKVGRVVLLDAEQGHEVAAKQTVVTAVALHDLPIVHSSVEVVQTS